MKQKDNVKQNYEEYHFSKTEILKYLLQSILLCSVMDYLFYQNWWLLILAVPVTVLFMKLKKKGLIRERKRNLNYQFKDALNALSVAVQAGYSVENAVTACSRDLERLYPKETDIVQEFHYIETQLRVSVPVEELLLSLGDRSGIEDVEKAMEPLFTTGGEERAGLGFAVMQSFCDKVSVRSKIGKGTAVTLEKNLLRRARSHE